MSSAAETNEKVSARDRRVFLRQLHSRAQHAGADRQGRLVLPDELCQKVGLKNEVALVGNRGRFEIWNLQRWQTGTRRGNGYLPACSKGDWIVSVCCANSS